MEEDDEEDGEDEEDEEEEDVAGAAVVAHQMAGTHRSHRYVICRNCRLHRAHTHTHLHTHTHTHTPNIYRASTASAPSGETCHRRPSVFLLPYVSYSAYHTNSSALFFSSIVLSS